MTRKRVGILLAPMLAGGVGLAAGSWTSLRAQETADSAGVRVPGAPNPAGAFLRGALIPGWGHTVSGAFTRGAFYFGVESASVWMLVKTIKKLDAVRGRVDFWEQRVTERLVADGVTDPLEVSAALDADPDVVRTRDLAAGREEQREDWLAVSIFFLLVSGVDAFVSAHLQDFPQPLTVDTRGEGERLELSVRIPVDLPGRP